MLTYNVVHKTLFVQHKARFILAMPSDSVDRSAQDAVSRRLTALCVWRTVAEPKYKYFQRRRRPNFHSGLGIGGL